MVTAANGDCFFPLCRLHLLLVVVVKNLIVGRGGREMWLEREGLAGGSTGLDKVLELWPF